MAVVDEIVATFGYFECASITTKIIFSWNGPAKSTTWICLHGFLGPSHRLIGAGAGVLYCQWYSFHGRCTSPAVGPAIIRLFV